MFVITNMFQVPVLQQSHYRAVHLGGLLQTNYQEGGRGMGKEREGGGRKEGDGEDGEGLKVICTNTLNFVH